MFQCAWFLIVILSLTGVYIWWKKRKAQSVAKSRASEKMQITEVRSPPTKRRETKLPSESGNLYRFG